VLGAHGCDNHGVSEPSRDGKIFTRCGHPPEWGGR
jgi:hypothetical protein